MAIKAVVFDFNGTLIDDIKQQQKAWGRLYKEQNLQAEDLGKLANHSGTFNLDGLKVLFPDKKLEELREISRRKEKLYRDYSIQDGIRLRPGVYDLLDDLKGKGIPFTVASASIPENIEFFRDHYRLAEYLTLQDIIYDDESFSDKSEMYQKAAGLLNVKPEEILVIEDSFAGVSGAIKAGAGEIFVINNEENKYLSDKVQKYPLHFFDSFEEIRKGVNKKLLEDGKKEPLSKI